LYVLFICTKLNSMPYHDASWLRLSVIGCWAVHYSWLSSSSKYRVCRHVCIRQIAGNFERSDRIPLYILDFCRATSSEYERVFALAVVHKEVTLKKFICSESDLTILTVQEKDMATDFFMSCISTWIIKFRPLTLTQYLMKNLKIRLFKRKKNGLRENVKFKWRNWNIEECHVWQSWIMNC
jgi:hypothetical protein